MNRRTLLKYLSTGALSPTLLPILNQAFAASDDKLSIRISGYDYDRVKSLVDSKIEIENCEYAFELDTIGGLNTDAIGGPMSREVTELGLMPYLLAYTNEGLHNHSLIPVFPLRAFRHKSIYIRPDRNINQPQDLRGKKIATPGYSSTSLTWIRGILQDEYGVSPKDIQWVIAREESSGKLSGGASRFENITPTGLTISEGPEGMNESDLLLSGEIDAIFHAAEPAAFTQGNPNCVRLFSDSRKVEQDYFEKTGIFPIMHVVAVRNDVAEEYPWLPRAIFEAYSEAKQNTYDFQRKHAWYKTTQPWISQDLDETRAVMGNNFYSYGFTEGNRKTLNTLFRYLHEQGFAEQLVTVEELFHPSTLELEEAS